MLINICGTARSGTTMLDLMLGNADDVFSCGEVYARFRPWRKHHFSIECSCDEQPCPVWERLKGVPAHRFHSAALAATGAKYIVDSSKELCWVVDNQAWAHRAGIGVVNVLIWKSPVELAYSFWKRGGDLMFWRRQFVNYHQEFFSTGLPYIPVAYDALVAQPSEQLERICNAIGMPYFPEKEKFWVRRHHHLFGSLGTRKQIEAGASELRATQYPDRFAQEIDGLERQIEQDAAVQMILQRLSTDKVHLSSRQGASPRLRRPWWYYPRRARQMYWKVFPEPEPDGH